MKWLTCKMGGIDILVNAQHVVAVIPETKGHMISLAVCTVNGVYMAYIEPNGPDLMTTIQWWLGENETRKKI